VQSGITIPFDLFSLSPVDLAHQITLLDNELFCLILPREFCDIKGWASYDEATREKYAPHINAMLLQSDMVLISLLSKRTISNLFLIS